MRCPSVWRAQPPKNTLARAGRAGLGADSSTLGARDRARPREVEPVYRRGREVMVLRRAAHVRGFRCGLVPELVAISCGQGRRGGGGGVQVQVRGCGSGPGRAGQGAEGEHCPATPCWWAGQSAPRQGELGGGSPRAAAAHHDEEGEHPLCLRELHARVDAQQAQQALRGTA